MTWRDKTCEKCAFRVGDECRRFPPDYRDDYPNVKSYAGRYSLACAEYAELIEPPKTTEG